MKKNIIIGIIVIVVIGIFACFSFYVQAKPPAAPHNVSGWAWSENIGWISFNNTSGGGTVNYGVNIGFDGLLSGYAWSENIGWISFNEGAQLDLDTGYLSGWAKVVSMPDGWIKLQGTAQNGSPYGVSLNSGTKEFEGWAWGSETIGWLSFNCNNPETGNVCGISNYKVETSFGFSLPPTAFDLTVEKGDYCSFPYHSFSWRFFDPEGGDQTAYHLKVGGDFDSGKISSASQNILVPVANNQLAYNTSYGWQVKVWDQNNISSDWTVGPAFNTETHMYPEPDFNWVPPSPAIEELVQFNPSLSDCYDINNNTISCSGKIFSWIFPADIEFSEGSSSSSENPQLKFLSSGPKPVSLQITDDVGACSKVKTINIGGFLPEWQEVSP